MRAFILFLFVTFFTHTAFSAPISDGLPSEIKDALSDAHKTKNPYVIEAVITYTKDSYPAHSKRIDSYLTTLAANKNAEKVEKQKTESTKKHLSGNIDMNLNIANGNTKQENLAASTVLNYETKQWKNTFKANARSGKKNKERNNEEYILNNQTQYKFSARDYSFLELEYVNDRFGGYQYRNSELLGYGHHFINNETFKLLGEASAGARQSLLTDGSKEKSLLGKLRAKADWQINSQMSFHQDISSSMGAEAVITVWDSSFKTSITKSIYLKMNYNLQHIDNVPVDTKHTDTLTTLVIGYEF